MVSGFPRPRSSRDAKTFKSIHSHTHALTQSQTHMCTYAHTYSLPFSPSPLPFCFCACPTLGCAQSSRVCGCILQPALPTSRLQLHEIGGVFRTLPCRKRLTGLRCDRAHDASPAYSDCSVRTHGSNRQTTSSQSATMMDGCRGSVRERQGVRSTVLSRAR